MSVSIQIGFSWVFSLLLLLLYCFCLCLRPNDIRQSFSKHWMRLYERLLEIKSWPIVWHSLRKPLIMTQCLLTVRANVNLLFIQILKSRKDNMKSRCGEDYIPWYRLMRFILLISILYRAWQYFRFGRICFRFRFTQPKRHRPKNVHIIKVNLFNCMENVEAISEIATISTGKFLQVTFASCLTYGK